ncbi:YheC/YheD family protein [Cohnella ginsengisoli]|uniref:YheC/YheD family protein n=1 Tax=Cohnella ginsengisoli TaxID=425004 RepID=A0A9X4KT81_9BACL|nr:YheC/YheD family protein [Cohnella ginsengisoli]MDG0795150.1 YheC/YheD family protein [Cohnella ginsengisoli]
MPKVIHIGVMTRRKGKSFFESGYFRHMHKEGEKLGLNVYFFSHEDVHVNKRLVYGYVPKINGGWIKKLFPWPDIVIDRYRSGWTPSFKALRNSGLLRIANPKFTTKNRATKLFEDTASMRKWIPETKPYHASTLKEMFNAHPILYLKPANGTGGAGVVQLRKRKNGISAQFRTRAMKVGKYKFPTIGKAVTAMNRWVQKEKIRGGAFLLQQGLDLELVQGRWADIRLFIQKNGSGNWEVTGIGVRQAAAGSPNTNLIAKGNQGYPFQSFMEKHFGEEKTRQIQHECEALAHETVKVIENRFGSMMEFGLDIGIDRNGHVWLLEVNPKPCKDIMWKIGESQNYLRTVRRPLQYAKYLAENKNGTP